jgi:hypothetical protein
MKFGNRVFGVRAARAPRFVRSVLAISSIRIKSPAALKRWRPAAEDVIARMWSSARSRTSTIRSPVWADRRSPLQQTTDDVDRPHVIHRQDGAAYSARQDTCQLRRPLAGLYKVPSRAFGEDHREAVAIELWIVRVGPDRLIATRSERRPCRGCCRSHHVTFHARLHRGAQNAHRPAARGNHKFIARNGSFASERRGYVLYVRTSRDGIVPPVVSRQISG